MERESNALKTRKPASPCPRPAERPAGPSLWPTCCDPKEIVDSIQRACRATGELTESLALRFSSRVLQQSLLRRNRRPLTCAELQHRVESALLSSPFKKTARFYHLFRGQHECPKELLCRTERTASPPTRERAVRWRLKRGARNLWRKRNAHWTSHNLSKAAKS